MCVWLICNYVVWCLKLIENLSPNIGASRCGLDEEALTNTNRDIGGTPRAERLLNGYEAAAARVIPSENLRLVGQTQEEGSHVQGVRSLVEKISTNRGHAANHLEAWNDVHVSAAGNAHNDVTNECVRDV